MMYAFVVIALLGGNPQPVVMERGLTEAECHKMMAQPDSGLSINGMKADGAKHCIPEESLPPPA